MRNPAIFSRERCGYADEYKGIRVPTCGCKACYETFARAEVGRSLERALANGYDMKGVRPEVVASDMVDFDTSFACVDPVVLVPYVREWQESRK